MTIAERLGKILLATGRKFSPADPNIPWLKVETLVHGPGASDSTNVANNGDGNSAVFACLMAIASAYPEPPLSVVLETDSGPKDLPDHPLAGLFAQPTPNGELSIEELLFWTAWAKHTDGNAYWIKVRSGNERTGNVVELWPCAPGRIQPASESGEWISHYNYFITANQKERIPVENVIHFRLGIDPKDMRKGLSPLKRLVRQLSTDEEADKFTDTLLRNYAIPGLVVVPKDGVYLDEPDSNRLSSVLQQKFGNDSRGNVAVLSQYADLKPFGFSPEEMDLTALHRIPEERISAVMGVPAIVAGLGAGLDRATLANAEEMSEWFTERKLVPNWRSDSAKLTRSLLPDFDSRPDVSVIFDLSDVRALQEDENERFARLNIGVSATRQWITVNEARADIGLDAIPGGDTLDSGQTTPAVLDETTGEESDEQEQDQEKAGVSGSDLEKKFSQNGHSHKSARRLTRAEQQKIVDALRSIRLIAAGQMQVLVSQYYRKHSEVVTGRTRELASTLVPDERIGIASAPAVATEAMTAEELEIILHQVLDDGGELEEIITRGYQDLMTDTWNLVNVALRAQIQFDVNDPLIISTLEGVGGKIHQIEQTTLESIIELLQYGSQNGWSIEKIIRGDPENNIAGLTSRIENTYAGRARTIARTELGTAQNAATVARYEAGSVSHVRVFDNGLADDDIACQEANGQIWTLAEAGSRALEHPNCTRAFAPVFSVTRD